MDDIKHNFSKSPKGGAGSLDPDREAPAAIDVASNAENTVLDADELTQTGVAHGATSKAGASISNGIIFTPEGFEALPNWGTTPEPPPIRWVVDNMFQADSTSWIAGEGGVGKTWIAADLVVSVATGEDFGPYSTQQGLGFIVNFDDTEALPRQFATRTACARGYVFKKLPIRYWEPPQNKPYPKAGLLEPWVFDRLSSLFKHHQPRLIIIDSFASAFPTVNGNLPKAVVDVHEKLRQLRSLSPGACLVILDHTPKSKKGGAAGSHQKSARVRSAHVVTRIDPKDAGGKDMLRWDFHKINGAPPQPSFALLREQDETTARLIACALPEHGSTPKADQALETALKLVQAAGGEGIARTALIKEVMARTQIGKRTIEEVVNDRVRPHPNVLELQLQGRGNPKGYCWREVSNDDPGEATPHDEFTQPDDPAQMEAAPDKPLDVVDTVYGFGLQFYCPKCAEEQKVSTRRRRKAAKVELRSVEWRAGTQEYVFEPAPICKKHRTRFTVNNASYNGMLFQGRPPAQELADAREAAKNHYATNSG